MKQPNTKPTWAEIRSLSGVMFHSAWIADRHNRKASFFAKRAKAAAAKRAKASS